MKVLHIAPDLPNIIHNSAYSFIEDIVININKFCDKDIFVLVPTKVISKSLFENLKISNKKFHMYFKKDFYLNKDINVIRMFYIPAFGIKKLNWLNCYFAWKMNKWKIINYIINNKINIIHAHGLIEGYIAKKIKQILGIPYIMHSHGRDIFYFNNLPSIEKELINIVYKNADHIIANSYKTRNNIIKFIGVSNVSVIYFGVNKFGKCKKIIDEKFKIVFIGHLIKRKGTEYLIKAIKLSKYSSKIEVTVIGDGEEKSNLELLIEKLDLKDKIKFLGRMKHDEVLNLLPNFNLLVMPSWNEALGVVYLEAMSMGLPVIGCYDEGISDFNKDFIMLVSPKNSADIAEKIDFLIDNPDIYEKYSNEALEFAKSNFNWEKISNEICNVYYSLLS